MSGVRATSTSHVGGTGEAVGSVVSVTAADGSPLAGRLWSPPSPSADVIVLTHGVASAHNRGMGQWLGSEMASRGSSVLAVDRRDALGAGGMHTFCDGIDDLRSAVDTAGSLGFERVVLVGHSKGTLFVPYYAATEADERVAAIGLFGLVHDNRVAARGSVMGPHYESNVAAARQAEADGVDRPIPLQSLGGPPLEMRPRSFLSLFGPDTKAVPTHWIRRVSVPVFACRASTDALTPAPFQDELVAAARGAGVEVTSVTIEDPDAGRDPLDGHRFTGLEATTADQFGAWLEGRLETEDK